MGGRFKKDDAKYAPGKGDIKMIDDITGFAIYSSNAIMNFAMDVSLAGQAQVLTTEDNADPIFPPMIKQYIPEVYVPTYVRIQSMDNPLDNTLLVSDSNVIWDQNTLTYRAPTVDEQTGIWDSSDIANGAD